MNDEHLGFSFQISSNGTVMIYHHDRLATTLRNNKAADFANKAEQFSEAQLQQLMARLTGNYKHGNERQGAKHQRNR